MTVRGPIIHLSSKNSSRARIEVIFAATTTTVKEKKE
jgi:hypothetical protein